MLVLIIVDHNFHMCCFISGLSFHVQQLSLLPFWTSSSTTKIKSDCPCIWFCCALCSQKMFSEQTNGQIPELLFSTESAVTSVPKETSQRVWFFFSLCEMCTVCSWVKNYNEESNLENSSTPSIFFFDLSLAPCFHFVGFWGTQCLIRHWLLKISFACSVLNISKIVQRQSF